MDLDEFYPELYAAFPEASYISLDRAILKAARRLCQLGFVWTKDLDGIDWEADESEYTPTLPDNSILVQIMSLGDLGNTTPQQLQRGDSTWRTRTGSPTYWYPLNNTQVRVYPIPTAFELEAEIPHVALAPTNAATSLDDSYAYHYEMLILEGALAVLGGGSWEAYEQKCREARSFASDKHQVGVARKVKYGGI